MTEEKTIIEEIFDKDHKDLPEELWKDYHAYRQYTIELMKKALSKGKEMEEKEVTAQICDDCLKVLGKQKSIDKTNWYFYLEKNHDLTKRVLELEHTLELARKLPEKITELEKQIDIAIETEKDYVKQIEQMEETGEDLRDQIAKVSSEKFKRSEKIAELEKENEELGEKLNDANEGRAKQGEHAVELFDAVKDLQQEVRKLKKERKQLAEELENLEKRVWTEDGMDENEYIKDQFVRVSDLKKIIEKLKGEK